MRYELYYWPDIQGRGEFVRLALEQGGAAYRDIAREGKRGMANMMQFMQETGRAPFAPPFLKAGKQVIAQTANILFYLGPRLGLTPNSESGRLWVHQLQLTIADFVAEIHDTHHPIAVSLYYHEQKREAKRRAGYLTGERMPKYLDYLERSRKTGATGNHWMLGRNMTYVDLSIFQITAGLRYAFPHTMKKLEPEYPGLISIHDRVEERPNIAAYLVSERRLPFNEHGIFRHYPELDMKG